MNRATSKEKNRGFRSPEWQTGPPQRNSRNSGDQPAYRRPIPSTTTPSTKASSSQALVISFCMMLVIGSGNKIFQKLQTLPMYNYPNFLNLLTTFMYIPLSFLYIIPVAKYQLLGGTITAEQLALPKRPFAIMGMLDCIAGIMQIFAATYLPGPLLILLSQMAIPVSMALSKNMLGATYQPYQYVGAIIVAAGIIVVLAPVLNTPANDTCQAYDEDEYCTICQDLTTESSCLEPYLNVTVGGVVTTNTTRICQWATEQSSSTGILIWSAVMVMSCIPMTLSSIYKEIALGETELDPVFLNGWIAVFQFLFSIPLAIPAAIASDPPVYPADLWDNMVGGLNCYFGKGTITSGCHPDDSCETQSIPFVNVYLLFNVSYNILIILILKFGDANILWLAMTIMVPVGNLAFALPFMPDPSELRATDVIGLGVIMGGLVLYRFGAGAWKRFFGEEDEGDIDEESGHKPLLTPVGEEVSPSEARRQRLSSEEPEKLGGVGRVGKSF